MKTVFSSHAMTAHVWAQQNQLYGNTSGDNRVFFEEKNLFSYGRHYILGHITADGTVLLNNEKRSICTTRHQSLAYNAVRHRTSYSVPNLTALVNRGALDKCITGNKRQHTSRAYAKIKNHIADNYMDYTKHAGVYLLETFGKSPRGAAIYDKIVAEMQKRKALATKQRLKSEAKAASVFLRRCAMISPAGLESIIDRGTLHNSNFVENTGRYQSTADRINGMLLIIRRNKRIATITKRQRGKINVMIKVMRNAVIYDTAQIERKRRIARRASAVKSLRISLKAITVDCNSDSMAQLTRLALTVSNIPTVPAATKSKLIKLAETAGNRTKELKDNEKRQEFKLEAEKRNRWLAGENVGRFYGSCEQGGALLRVKNLAYDDFGGITAGTLETSQGADVPLLAAIKVYHAVKRCRQRETPWQANGETIRVGYFTLNWIDAQGNFKAGCHKIMWDEIHRIAFELGLAQ